MASPLIISGGIRPDKIGFVIGSASISETVGLYRDAGDNLVLKDVLSGAVTLSSIIASGSVGGLSGTKIKTGRVTIPQGADTAVVDFTNGGANPEYAFPNSLYSIALTPSEEINVSYFAKGASGFEVKSSSIAGVGGITIDWTATHD